MTRSLPAIAMCLVALALHVVPAQAQELTVGYHTERQELHDGQPDTLRGFHMEAARVTAPAAVVVLFERATGSRTSTSRAGTLTETTTLSTLGFGARCGGGVSPSRPVMPFVELVGGVVMPSSQESWDYSTGGRYTYGDDGGTSAMMIGAAGGVVIRLGRHVALSARADYRLMGNVFGGASARAASAGIRYRFR